MRMSLLVSVKPRNLLRVEFFFSGSKCSDCGRDCNKAHTVKIEVLEGSTKAALAVVRRSQIHDCEGGSEPHEYYRTI